MLAFWITLASVGYLCLGAVIVRICNWIGEGDANNIHWADPYGDHLPGLAWLVLLFWPLIAAGGTLWGLGFLLWLPLSFLAGDKA